jgi:hypothetical protein
VSKLGKTTVFVATGVRSSQVYTKHLHHTVQHYAWVSVEQSRLDQFIYVYVGDSATGNIENYVWWVGRSQWPRGRSRRSAAFRLLRSWVRMPLGAWMSVVSVVCCAGRGLWDGLITRPEKSYRLLCVVVCDLENLMKGRPGPLGGCSARNKQANKQNIWLINCVWNVMAHAQKPDFVFRRNGRVHLSRRGRHFSRLLAAEVCASAVLILDTPCSEVVWRVLATHSIHQFPLHFPLPCVTVCHHFSTGLSLISEYFGTLKSYYEQDVQWRWRTKFCVLLQWCWYRATSGLRSQYPWTAIKPAAAINFLDHLSFFLMSVKVKGDVLGRGAVDGRRPWNTMET